MTGYEEYRPLADRFHVPIVVTGFEPVDLLHGILQCVRQIEEGCAEVENAYPRAVRADGNPAARELLSSVFQECDSEWRGIGMLPLSGWELRPEFAAWNAEKNFADVFAGLPEGLEEAASGCRSGDVLQGKITSDCGPLWPARPCPGSAEIFRAYAPRTRTLTGNGKIRAGLAGCGNRARRRISSVGLPGASRA